MPKNVWMPMSNLTSFENWFCLPPAYHNLAPNSPALLWHWRPHGAKFSRPIVALASPLSTRSLAKKRSRRCPAYGAPRQGRSQRRRLGWLPPISHHLRAWMAPVRTRAARSATRRYCGVSWGVELISDRAFLSPLSSTLFCDKHVRFTYQNHL